MIKENDKVRLKATPHATGTVDELWEAYGVAMASIVWDVSGCVGEGPLADVEPVPAPTLCLALKEEYFLQIKSGEKVEEFRETTDYWKRRLIGKTFDHIVLTHGYPKSDDTEKRITRPWLGYEIKTITHPHFGGEPVEVFAIKVN